MNVDLKLRSWHLILFAITAPEILCAQPHSEQTYIPGRLFDIGPCGDFGIYSTVFDSNGFEIDSFGVNDTDITHKFFIARIENLDPFEIILIDTIETTLFNPQAVRFVNCSTVAYIHIDSTDEAIPWRSFLMSRIFTAPKRTTMILRSVSEQPYEVLRLTGWKFFLIPEDSLLIHRVDQRCMISKIISEDSVANLKTLPVSQYLTFTYLYDRKQIIYSQWDWDGASDPTLSDSMSLVLYDWSSDTYDTLLTSRADLLQPALSKVNGYLYYYKLPHTDDSNVAPNVWRLDSSGLEQQVTFFDFTTELKRFHILGDSLACWLCPKGCLGDLDPRYEIRIVQLP